MVAIDGDLNARAVEALRAYRACLEEAEAAEILRERTYRTVRVVRYRLRRAVEALLRRERHEDIEQLTRDSEAALSCAREANLSYQAACMRLDTAHEIYAGLDKQLGYVPAG